MYQHYETHAILKNKIKILDAMCIEKVMKIINEVFVYINFLHYQFYNIILYQFKILPFKTFIR